MTKNKLTQYEMKVRQAHLDYESRTKDISQKSGNFKASETGARQLASIRRGYYLREKLKAEKKERDWKRGGKWA